MHEILNRACPLDQHALLPGSVLQGDCDWESAGVQANGNADDGVAWPCLVDAVVWDVSVVYLLVRRAAVQRPFDHKGEGRLAQ